MRPSIFTWIVQHPSPNTSPSNDSSKGSVNISSIILRALSLSREQSSDVGLAISFGGSLCSDATWRPAFWI